jgi:L-fucose isomerase-like protein
MIPRVTLATPRLLPVHLEDDRPKASFHRQLAHLQERLGGLVEFLEPAPIGAAPSSDASAVIVPDLNGLAYRRLDAFRAIGVPILLITSEFATVSMWDWEIRDFLRRRGVATIAPTSQQESEDVCRALAVRDTLARASMLAYQDDLGAGMQPDIFKRFFWWEDQCVEGLRERFGVTTEHRSYRALAARAAAVPQERVDAVAERIDVPMAGLSATAKTEALRLYVALGDELDEAGDVVAAGINCLNESATSPTTPCLAWNLLFEERGLMWGCEADLVSMLTEFIVHKSLGVPVMMSNLYPFLMGDAALKHERIPYFPDVEEPEHHVLVGHVGYFGEIPQSFATEWVCRPRVLRIVDERAHAIDARLPEGPTTIVKLASTMDTLVVSPAVLTGYVQYSDSDCLNGGVLRVEDGYRFVERLPSHHAIFASGDLRRRLDVVGQVLGLGVERI